MVANLLSLTIVIPALNEEGAIGNTIDRCLAARERIMGAGGLASVEIVVVSDGSTDRTAEIAKGYDDVKVIIFEKNRGYGAAIKDGWREGTGNLLGFLDADGTCDPVCFAEMCRVAVDESADVVLGSRLGPESKMSGIRRLGNRIYAFLLGLVCGRQVTDTASGMRVVRRDSLKWLYPLPDGLHFTPSMSARALLNDLRVIEVPIRYEERIGTSKLSVLRDGVRFLRTIFSGVLCYRPEKLLLMMFVICMATMALLAAYPVEFYFQNRRLEEWMIYRFVVCYLLGSFELMLLLATALTYQMANLGPRRESANAFWPFVVASLMRGRALIGIVVCLLVLSGVFLWPGISEYVTTGHITLHWSRLLAGAFNLYCVLQTAVFALLLKVLSVWRVQQAHSESPSQNRLGEGDSPRSSDHRGDGARKKISSGFTIVELLVVITIMGILIALLLPAVLTAREAARPVQCKNNVRQVGLAAVHHLDSHRFYPSGGWRWNWVGDPDRGFGSRQPGGWLYSMLPFIEQKDVWRMGAGIDFGVVAEQAAEFVLILRNELLVVLAISLGWRAWTWTRRPAALESGETPHLRA